jgi:RHS repeat-associated protein
LSKEPLPKNYNLNLLNGNNIKRITTRVNDQVYYIHSDHLGSTSLLTDEQGNETSRIHYSPYGWFIETTGAESLPTDRLFTGQRLENIGLYDYRARFYDPLTANFLSPDSIVPQPGQPVDWNRYAYVRGNPIRYTDPSGHCGPCIPIIIGIVIGGFIAYDYLAHPDIAKAPGPFDVIIDNPPIPTDLPGNDEALCLFCRDLQEGNLRKAAILAGVEATPFDEIPGVKPILKGAGDAVVEAMFDFGWKARFIQHLRPQKYGTFGDTWGWLAYVFNESGTDRKLFAHYDEAGEITGAMYILPLQNGDLYIDKLEGLGGGSGTALFKQAILESQRNYSGAIVLESTDEAYGWYMKLNPTRVEGNKFYWSPEDAAKLLR